MNDRELRAIERLALRWGPSDSDQCWLWHQKEYEARKLSDQQTQQAALDFAFQERFEMLQLLAKHQRARNFLLHYCSSEGSGISELSPQQLRIWADGNYSNLPRAITLLLRFADGDGGFSLPNLIHHLHRELIEPEEANVLSQAIERNLLLAG